MEDIRLKDDIRERLADEFQFKARGEFYRGKCPSCGEKEAWTKVDEPYVVFCSRENKCGERNTARELFPDLFENFSERFPSSPEDPERTAREYLSQDRRFNLSLITGTWHQGYMPLVNGEKTPTVRFPLWGNAYWERVIDKRAMPFLPPQAKGKTHFSAGIKYSGKCWHLPDLKLKKKDQVLIVEGIFHVIALATVGVKAIAAFSCNNIPTEFIEKHKNYDLTWCLAYDNDRAGINAITKFREQLIGMRQRVKVMLAPSKRRDWDDCLRAGVFDDEKFWLDAEYRGHLAIAETAEEYAYHQFRRGNNPFLVFRFDNQTWKCNASDVMTNIGDVELQSSAGRSVFQQHASIKNISNCTQALLYQERDDIMDERRYVFKIQYGHSHPDDIVEFEGSNIENPAAFNKALLNRTAGGTFSGERAEFDVLKNRWLKTLKIIQSIPYVGYYADLGVYVYQKFAVYKGREIVLNDEGYFDLGKLGVKTSMRSPAIVHGKQFSTKWFYDLHTAFGDNGLIALGFWTATLFVQQIRRQHKSFPFLEMTGEPGAGKSTLIETLWHLCGRDYEGFDPQKATKAGIRRAFNQVANLPVVLIEGDHIANTDAKQRGFTFDSIKPLYDGRGTGTLGVAKRGNDTDEPMFNGSVVIAQNASVTGEEALMERIVHLYFTAAPLKTRDAAMRLRNAPLEDMAGYLPHVVKKEKDYLEHYFQLTDAFDKRLRSEEGISSVKQRLVFNHAQIMASVACLAMYFDEVTDHVLESAYKLILERLRLRHKRLSGDSPMLEEFWEIFHYIDEKGEARESAFGHTDEQPKLNHHKEPNAFIAVNLNDFVEQCRKHNQPIPELTELKRQLPASKTHKFVDTKKYRSQLTNKPINCWIFERKYR